MNVSPADPGLTDMPTTVAGVLCDERSLTDGASCPALTAGDAVVWQLWATETIPRINHVIVTITIAFRLIFTLQGPGPIV
jgi:hypothetical protein